MRLLKDAQFGVVSFYGVNDELGNKCGPNGLPLTPSSVQIVGRFQKLKSLEHPNLCKYLDIQRGKHGKHGYGKFVKKLKKITAKVRRYQILLLMNLFACIILVSFRFFIEIVFLVTEYHSRNLASLVCDAELKKSFDRIVFDILGALSFLHENGIVHRNLSLENIVLCEKENIRLCHYGLYHITDAEVLVSFRIGNTIYLPPEVILARSTYKNSPSVDIYAFGLIILQIQWGIHICDVYDKRHLPDIIRRFIRFVEKNINGSAFKFYIELVENFTKKKLDPIDPNWLEVIEQCLMVHPSKSARIVLHTDYRGSEITGAIYQGTGAWDIPNFIYIHTNLEDVNVLLNEPIKCRPIDEVYYLWKIAGSNIENILIKKGLLKSQPSIVTLPNVAINECDIFGNEDHRRHFIDLDVTILSMNNLLERLKTIKIDHYYPSFEYGTLHSSCDSKIVRSDSSACFVDDLFIMSQLPKVVKEKDIQYQLVRMVLFSLLIDAYPFKKSIIWHESHIDIPPVYRGLVWCTLLDVTGEVKSEYDMIDKETATTTDRQIEVDIPRCHQYDELLFSPESHRKFKRVLKAWVVNHPEYVYWQGLDSLCAPFLYLNFNHEGLAYSCLKNFIPKYLHNFFLKDNSAIMQEYLVVFDHLICFHDPELYFHLNDIGFNPDLYAIPWFLTMFAHLLPLHKLFHLWDTLLLGNNSFPLCVGVAVLLQLRNRLISYGFNECILLFSDMPEIDIERCVTAAIKVFRETPKSALYRQYMPPDAKTKIQQKFVLEDQRGLMEPLTLAQLKAEHCPRLYANDLITIQKAKESGTSTPSFDVLCVDIRLFEEFAKGAFPYSINLPHNLLFIDGKFTLNNVACDKLKNHESKLICVIGSNADDRRALETAEHFMRNGYSRVTILHKGIGILRQLQVLTVP